MRRIALTIASFALLATPASAARLETWTLHSQYVDPAKEAFNGPAPGAPARPNALRVNVLLPDGYDGRKRFPLLWLLHGHGDSYDHWASPQRGNVQQIAESLRAVIAMPEGARGWYADWFNGGRRLPGWERFYLDELMPLVERRLKLRPGRANRAIAGLSMGAEGAAYFASQRPGTFGALGVFSGPLSLQRPEWPVAFDTQGERHVDVFGDPDTNAFYWEGHNPTALAPNLRWTRVYATVGNGVPRETGELSNWFGAIAEAELHSHNDDFVAALTAQGAPVTYVPRQGIHDWPYWREHLAAFLRWDPFESTTERPSRWAYKTVRRSGTAWDVRFAFEQPPAAVVVFERAGDVLRAHGGNGTVRIRAKGYRAFTAQVPFERHLERPVRKRKR